MQARLEASQPAPAMMLRRCRICKCMALTIIASILLLPQHQAQVAVPYQNIARGRSNGRAGTTSPAVNRSNLLFIMFDDLRPELSIYGKNTITPNFERLAQRSMVFDNAFSQLSVCNPSRCSLLTGLRPDNLKVFNFQTYYDQELIIPTMLMRNGYRTSVNGKVRHHELMPSEDIWNEKYYADWYEHQNQEANHMNSSVMPDEVAPEASFLDYKFTTRTIESLRRYHKTGESYMLNLGFKLPHTCLHMPFKYFNLYRNRDPGRWKLPDSARKFPPSSPLQAYHYSSFPQFRAMKQEGRLLRRKSVDIDDINHQVHPRMYEELMWGYSAAISFLDAQLGRILDVVDELDLWKNLTIILTADHGTHNGEKGMWGKWTLFDESTKVPLLISHPKTNEYGRRYAQPVELVDIYPTVMDLLGISESDRTRACRLGGDIHDATKRNQHACRRLSGKSLADVVLNIQDPQSGYDRVPTGYVEGVGVASEVASKTAYALMPFALSQVLVCAQKDAYRRSMLTQPGEKRPNFVWLECDLRKYPLDTVHEMKVMGYSMRTLYFRYTIWLQVDPKTFVPRGLKPLAEELYDHRNNTIMVTEKLGRRYEIHGSDLGQRELVNLAYDQDHTSIVTAHRRRLLRYLQMVVHYKTAGEA